MGSQKKLLIEEHRNLPDPEAEQHEADVAEQKADQEKGKKEINIEKKKE